MTDLHNRLNLAENAARQAGAFLLGALPGKRSIKKKGTVDLVTEADRRSEKMIYEIIAELYPEDRFLAEEGTESDSDSDFLWVVDPLDGTINYAHRYPVFCVSIAVVRKGLPVAACIYNPNLEECFTALKGAGAKLNGTPIHVSQNKQLIDSLLATGFPYDVRESEADNMNNFIMFYNTNCHCIY